MPICFFQAFYGLCKVILTRACWLGSIWSLRWNRGLVVQVNLSAFCSNALWYRWQPPADFSVHLPEMTAFLFSSSIWISTCWDEKTKKNKIKFNIRNLYVLLTRKCEIARQLFLHHTRNNDEWTLCRLVERVERRMFIALVTRFDEPFAVEDL